MYLTGFITQASRYVQYSGIYGRLHKGSIELIGPFGFEVGLVKLSKNITSLSTGIVTSYALYILMGFVIYLLITYLTLLNFDIVLLFILTLIL